MTATRRGAIVVTGASTGIGRAAVLHLASLGFRIYAGVRREADGTALQEKCPERLTWTLLDVTNERQIEAAANLIAREVGEHGLTGLLNNAGISVNGPLELVPIDDLRRQFETNVVGHVAVTQALLPLIRKARGRIVNMGSILGRMSIALCGPYSASKFAMEAITDALRMELRSWGIEVIIIEPGAVETPLWEKSVDAAVKRLAGMPPETKEHYNAMIAKGTEIAQATARIAVSVDKVSRVIEHAFTAPKPRTRYLVGRDAKLQGLMTYLPDRWCDRIILKYLNRRA